VCSGCVGWFKNKFHAINCFPQNGKNVSSVLPIQTNQQNIWNSKKSPLAPLQITLAIRF